MQQSEFVAKLAEKSGLSKDQAASALKGFEAAVTDVLAAGDDVRISGFLTIKAQKKEASKGRNPSTGAEIDIPARTVAKFAVGKRFKDAVDAA